MNVRPQPRNASHGRLSGLALVVLAAAGFPEDSSATQRTAALGVSAVVIASCRIEMPLSHPDMPGVLQPLSRIVCPKASRPATRAVLQRSAQKDRDFRFVRYDVEY
jgi:hypothetical protein